MLFGGGEVDEPELGRVIWADVVDPQGRPAGEHAAIILTTKAEYAAGQPIKAVVISSKLHLGTPGAMVMMKHLKRERGHPRTGLTKKCAAMCNRIVSVEESDIRRYCGLIYGKDLEEILKCIRVSQQQST